MYVDPKPKPKITICNMWRTWREDSVEDKKKAFTNDTSTSESFNPKLYLK